MNIVEWFEPNNSVHILAYYHMLRHFNWPDDFEAKDIVFKYPDNWRDRINEKIVRSVIEKAQML